MAQNELVINKRLKYLLVNDAVEKYTIVLSLARCAQTKKCLKKRSAIELAEFFEISSAP